MVKDDYYLLQLEWTKKKNVLFLIFRHYYEVSHLVKFQQINSSIIKLLLGVFILSSDIGPSTYRI